MDLYETELPDARARIAAAGRNPDDFTFRMEYLPPDPDGGGMFTVQYEVTAANAATGKTRKLVGGIGMRWVERFDDLLKQGWFD